MDSFEIEHDEVVLFESSVHIEDVKVNVALDAVDSVLGIDTRNTVKRVLEKRKNESIR